MENQEPLSPLPNPVPATDPKSSKRQAIILIVSGLILIAATAPFLYQKYFAPETTENLSTNSQATTTTSTSSGQANEFADWQTYRNEEYGFEIKYPPITEGGQTEILEYNKAVYIYPLEWKPSIDYLKKRENENFRGTWAIVVKKVANKEEIDTLIKSRYGKDCEWEIRQDHVKIDSDIVITTGYAPDESELDCFVNWITVLKYNKELGKLAIWDIGQDSTFRPLKSDIIGYGFETSYDFEMADSFRFIK